MRRYFIYICIVLFTMGLLYACVRDNVDAYRSPQNDSSTLLSVAEAREFFENQFLQTTKTRSEGLHKPKGMHPGEFTPDWDAAEVSQNNKIASVDVRILPQCRYRAIRSEFKNGKAKAYTANITQKLIVIKGKRQDKLGQYILTLVPDRTYFAKNKGDISDKFIQAGEKNGFSGVAFYSTLQGRTVRINIFANGKKVKGLYLDPEKSDEVQVALKKLKQQYPIKFQRNGNARTRSFGFGEDDEDGICPNCGGSGCSECSGYNCWYCMDNGCEYCQPSSGECEYCSGAGCTYCQGEIPFYCEVCGGVGCSFCTGEVPPVETTYCNYCWRPISDCICGLICDYCGEYPCICDLFCGMCGQFPCACCPDCFTYPCICSDDNDYDKLCSFGYYHNGEECDCCGICMGPCHGDHGQEPTLNLCKYGICDLDHGACTCCSICKGACLCPNNRCHKDPCICFKEEKIDCAQISPSAVANSENMTVLYNEMTGAQGYSDFKKAVANDPSHEYGITAYTDNDDATIYLTKPYTEGKTNSTSVHTMKGRRVCNLSMAHNHPEETPCSVTDIEALIKVSQIDPAFRSIYVNSLDGQSYVLYIEDHQALNRFANSPDLERLEPRYKEAVTFLTYQGAQGNERSLYAIAYALNKLNTGIVILSKDKSSGQFKQHNCIGVEDENNALINLINEKCKD